MLSYCIWCHFLRKAYGIGEAECDADALNRANTDKEAKEENLVDKFKKAFSRENIEIS